MRDILAPGTEARLTVLSTFPASIPVRVEEYRGVQMHLRLNSPLAFAAPVKVETENVLVLGDVSHCDRRGEEYVAGVTVRHLMEMLVDLQRLNQRLTEAERPVHTPMLSPIL